MSREFYIWMFRICFVVIAVCLKIMFFDEPLYQKVCKTRMGCVILFLTFMVAGILLTISMCKYE